MRLKDVVRPALHLLYYCTCILVRLEYLRTPFDILDESAINSPDHSVLVSYTPFKRLLIYN